MEKVQGFKTLMQLLHNVFYFTLGSIQLILTILSVNTKQPFCLIEYMEGQGRYKKRDDINEWSLRQNDITRKVEDTSCR